MADETSFETQQVFYTDVINNPWRKHYKLDITRSGVVEKEVKTLNLARKQEPRDDNAKCNNNTSGNKRVSCVRDQHERISPRSSSKPRALKTYCK